MCQLSWNLGASTSWKPQGKFGPVVGLLYLFFFTKGALVRKLVDFLESGHRSVTSTQQSLSRNGSLSVARGVVRDSYTIWPVRDPLGNSCDPCFHLKTERDFSKLYPKYDSLDDGEKCSSCRCNISLVKSCVSWNVVVKKGLAVQGRSVHATYILHGEIFFPPATTIRASTVSAPAVMLFSSPLRFVMTDLTDNKSTPHTSPYTLVFYVEMFQTFTSAFKFSSY